MHVSSDLLLPTAGVTGTLQITATRWADTRTGPANASWSKSVSVPAQGGTNATVEGGEFARMLQAASCGAVGECFLQMTLALTPAAETGSESGSSGGSTAGEEQNSEYAYAPAHSHEQVQVQVPSNYQWLTLWRDAELVPAELTITTRTATSTSDNTTTTLTGVVHVTVSSDVVSPNVMVHCREPTDFGSFDTNGVLLLPGQPATLVYTPRAFSPRGGVGAHTPCATSADFYAVAVNGLSDAA